MTCSILQRHKRQAYDAMDDAASTSPYDIGRHAKATAVAGLALVSNMPTYHWSRDIHVRRIDDMLGVWRRNQ